MTVTLTPELEARIKEEAEKQGVEAEALALRLMEAALPESPADPPMTRGARLLAKWKAENIIGMWKDRPEDTLELARQLRAKAERRGGSL